MKATGIVRRVDDLGRIVIPKEIRRSMNIREGDPLEIFIDQSTRGVIFRPYEVCPEVWTTTRKLLDSSAFPLMVLIVVRGECVFTRKLPSSYKGTITPELDNKINATSEGLCDIPLDDMANDRICFKIGLPPYVASHSYLLVVNHVPNETELAVLRMVSSYIAEEINN